MRSGEILGCDCKHSEYDVVSLQDRWRHLYLIDAVHRQIEWIRD